MKAFKFRLEAVLALRQREEEQAEQIFGKAVQQRNQAALALDHGRDGLDASFAALAAGRTGATSRNDQILLLNALQQQQQHCELLTQRLAAADREVAAKRGAFLAARRKREALTKLRERQAHAHRVAQDRAIENDLSDLISARHVHTLQEVTS